jgi:hypothetical protein
MIDCCAELCGAQVVAVTVVLSVLMSENAMDICTRLTTIQRLDKINKAHNVILKRKNSSELLKANLLKGLVSYVGHYVMEDHRVQAMLVWIAWLTLAALFYTIKMQVTFYKGVYGVTMDEL